MSVQSAGLLLYRQRDGKLEVLLVHPGGPFWQKRDEGAWSVPKGEFAENEVGIDVARREFQEELGTAAPAGEVTPLGEVRQRGGKVIHAWAMLGDPRSGKMQRFPEVDRAAWFDFATARRKVLPAQSAFIDRLKEQL
ncbi:MAG: NUDIX domain-containing protein [Chloroflexi bacterium]|nr:MAG: NUDIX domain-containing protein [Chloroflexota bacterium]